MEKSKGQLALEYMFISAIGMLIIWGFVAVVKTRLSDSQEDALVIQTEELMKKVTLAANDVSAAGPSARSSVIFDMPKNVENVTVVSDTSGNKYLEIQMRFGSTIRGLNYTLPRNIEINETATANPSKLTSNAGKHVFVISSTLPGSATPPVEIIEVPTPNNFLLKITANQSEYIIGNQIELT